MEPGDLLSPCLPVTAGIATHSKVYRDGKGTLLKWSRGGNAERIREEFEFLSAMAPEGVSPIPYAFGPGHILMQDLGDSEPLLDLEAATVGATRLLWALQRHGIRHRDLMPQNMVIKGRGALVYAVDFGWAQWSIELVDPKYEPDAKRLKQSLCQLAGRSILKLVGARWES